MKKILALFTLIPTLINAEQNCYQRTTKRASRYAISEGSEKYHTGSYAQKPVCKDVPHQSVYKNNVINKQNQQQQSADNVKKKIFKLYGN